MSLQIPKPKITKEQWDKFLKDPEVVSLECLFVFLTLCNIFVLYRILLDICPFPVTVTWVQLLMGFLFAFVLGIAGHEFPQFSFFPPFSIDWSLYQSLAVPTLVYIGMITLANLLLSSIPSVASFPVAVSLAVFLHHVSRFVGCGQVYLPIRWIAMATMLIGFLIGVIDPRTVGIAALPVALLYAMCSSVFRAWCLEKAMHVVEGRGNTLHNHQVVFGLIVLPLLAIWHGELAIFSWMPKHFDTIFTWQSWGVLVVAGTLPFVKNVIANRMIRRTGQAPWRILEATSMVLIFLVGAGVWDTVSIASVVAFILVLGGRVLAMFDALSKDPTERRRALRQERQQREEPQHQAPPPSHHEGLANYDPTGVSDSFDRSEQEEVTYEFQRDNIIVRPLPSNQHVKPLLLMGPIPERVTSTISDNSFLL